MQFARFTQYGTLSNWGWYSTAEKALLKKEDDVSKHFTRLEPFMKKKTELLVLFMDFMSIRVNHAVTALEMPQISQELDDIDASVKALRLDALDAAGDDVPQPTQTFKNHQPDALVGEIRTYLEYRKLNKYDTTNPFASGFVIHLNLKNLNTRTKFREIIDSGQKVNWALDKDDILSIGDPKSTKHSVVAVGQDVWAAGIAQLDLDPKLDLYLAMMGEADRVRAFETQAANTSDEKKKKELEENAKYWQGEVDRFNLALNGWKPPVDAVKGDTVVLDFDSGHYTPSGAWKAAKEGWNTVGYKVKWSRDARHV
jgi:hypothetical protein